MSHHIAVLIWVSGRFWSLHLGFRFRFNHRFTFLSVHGHSLRTTSPLSSARLGSGASLQRRYSYLRSLLVSDGHLPRFAPSTGLVAGNDRLVTVSFSIEHIHHSIPNPPYDSNIPSGLSSKLNCVSIHPACFRISHTSIFFSSHFLPIDPTHRAPRLLSALTDYPPTSTYPPTLFDTSLTSRTWVVIKGYEIDSRNSSLNNGKSHSARSECQCYIYALLDVVVFS